MLGYLVPYYGVVDLATIKMNKKYIVKVKIMIVKT